MYCECACVNLCAPQAYSIQGGQKMALAPLGLGVWAVVSHPEGAGNWTVVHYESSEHSWPRSHLFSVNSTST